MKLKIAVQKSGRLRDDSLKLLKDSGISIDNGKDQLKASAYGFPLEVLYLRNSDIPQYVEDGVADIAIVGENVLYEQEPRVEVVQNLGFSKCHVAIAVPKELGEIDLSYLNGKKIATSYPNTVQKFLKSNNLNAEIHKISGSVEIAPNIGLADAICDIVSSGSTLFKNGLIETYKLLDSQAVLIKNKELSPEKEQILSQLSFRIASVLRAKNYKYILLNAPNEKIDEISRILPVLKSPTVLPLAEKGWSSLHSVIEKGSFWEMIDKLKAVGAQDILVIPIEKMVL